MESIISILFFVVLMIVGYVYGTLNESKHYESIVQREKELIALPAVTSRQLEGNNAIEAQMVTGSVVISVDYFKNFLAGLRNFFGGRMVSFESLYDRARREAMLRMKQKASDWGADIIYNVRLESASLGSDNVGNSGVGCFEILAYGTAVKLNKS